MKPTSSSDAYGGACDNGDRAHMKPVNSLGIGIGIEPSSVGRNDHPLITIRIHALVTDLSAEDVHTEYFAAVQYTIELWVYDLQPNG